jgi:LuxR family maltose regulon positive regulatory protein
MLTQTWNGVAFEEIAGLLTEGQLSAAHARLAQLRFDPDPLAPARTVEIELLLGWMGALEGRRAAARDHFHNAVAVAAPEGLVDPFVRIGSTVAELVDELIATRTEFSRFAVGRARAAAAAQDRKLVDDLTPRELELLAYLPSRLTIADIAARCFVSTNTIKTHLGHIYRKLGVSGRDAAIQRAVELGLIDAREIARVG